VIHGKLDNILPFEHSEQLFAAINLHKFSLWVEDANHNDLSSVAG
jgi:fermentation-respiration switch protein FrsA (DUF1100 family)